MPKTKKVLPTKDFAEKQLEEIKEINKNLKKRFRKTILIAFLANLILVLVLFVLLWYVRNR